MVTIGVDASRLSVEGRTGTESYSAEIVRSLAAAVARDDVLVIYLNAPALPRDIVLPRRCLLRPISFPRAWTHARLSLELARRPPDVLFVPSHVVPLWHPPSVVTIHDLGYLVEPGSHRAADRRRLDLSTRWSVHAARRVIAVSESTARALVAAYRVPRDKIRVIYHGVSPRFAPKTEDEIRRVRAMYRLPERYILTVGTIQPRKNLPALVEAMGVVAAANLPHRLVVVGKPGWLANQVESSIALADRDWRVHRLGYVPSGDLPALYSGADVFALPSLYEGFGMPVLEAMACGVPTLVSDRAALPEIAGGAGLVVDPKDPAAIGRSLVRLIADEGDRSSYVASGFSRAATFTWERAAEQTLAVLHEAASMGNQSPSP